MAMEISADRVAEVASELFLRGVVLGQTHSVGLHTPAVLGPPHEWVVVDLRGGACVYAHDAYEACLWFVGLEEGDRWFGDPEELELLSDATIVHHAAIERRETYGWRYAYYNMTLDSGREALAEARAEFLGVLANTGKGDDHA